MSFLLRALIAGSIVGLTAPLLGTTLVLRRDTFLAEALGHAALTGVALGALVAVAPLPAALVTTTLSALLLVYVRSKGALPRESSLGILLYASLGFAAIALTVARSAGLRISGLLFGSLLTVSTTDVYIIFALGAVTIACALLARRTLMGLSLDAAWAASAGMPTRLVEYLFTLLCAITVAMALPTVGALLVGALMILPPLAALQLKFSYGRTLLAASCLGLLDVLLGMGISYQWDLPSGGTVVLTSVLVLGVVALVQRVSRYPSSHVST